MARFVLLDRETWTRPGKRNDCTVRALALTCDLTYEQAEAKLKRVGRRHNKGFKVARAFRWRRIKGRLIQEKVNGAMLIGNRFYPRGEMTIAKFLDQNKVGRFVIETGCHAIAVIDGATHDLWQMRESTSVKCVLTLRVPRRRARPKTGRTVDVVVGYEQPADLGR